MIASDARHQQRGHDRRALEGVHVGGVDRAVGAQRHQPREVDTGRHHAAYERLALADGGAVGIDPLDPQPTGRVEQVGVGERRALGLVEVGRPLAAVGGGEDDPAAERVAHGLGDRGEVAALEHDVGERGVERVGTVQRGDRLRVAYQVLAHFCPLLRQDVTFASVPRADSVWGVSPRPIPVAAPTRVRAAARRGRADGPRPVLHASATAIYVDLDGWCLGLVSATATRVPCALWSTLPDLGGLAGQPVVASSAERSPSAATEAADRPRSSTPARPPSDVMGDPGPNPRSP